MLRLRSCQLQKNLDACHAAALRQKPGPNATILKTPQATFSTLLPVQPNPSHTLYFKLPSEIIEPLNPKP